MTAYYNEIDPYAAAWLRNLIAAGHIAPGDVDERSICDVRASDLIGYEQCHFFAGIGGWSLALRFVGWDDARSVWTGSCPCQPFSSAGRRKGSADERHLWPHWFGLIRECCPPIVFGEQVARAIGSRWLDAVAHDLEGEAYAFGAAVLPACAVGAPHRRDRLWFVADARGAELWDQSGRRHGANGQGAPLAGNNGAALPMADADSGGWQARHRDLSAAGYRRPAAAGGDDGNPDLTRLAVGQGERSNTRAQQPATQRADWWAIEPGMGRVAHGVSARVGKLRAYGNAIVPQAAAEFIGAYLDVCGMTAPKEILP